MLHSHVIHVRPGGCIRLGRRAQSLVPLRHEIDASFCSQLSSPALALAPHIRNMPAIELNTNDLLEILKFTTDLARKAGDLILTGSEAIRASGNVDEKKNSVDLVTEYDVKVEELVRGELSKKYTGFKLCVFSRSCQLILRQGHICGEPRYTCTGSRLLCPCRPFSSDQTS